MAQSVRIASINTNGIRAAYRKGMGDWLATRDIDILAIQEVRASTEDVVGLLGDDWHVLHDPCNQKAAPASQLQAASRPSHTASSSATSQSTAQAAGSKPTSKLTARCLPL